MILSKKKILITGGAGFIGSNLVEKLIIQDNDIVVLDNLSTGFLSNVKPFLNNPNFSFIQGDIRNSDDCKKACEGVDIVLHQAALGSVPRSILDPVTTNAVNVDGFLNMLVACKDAEVKRFVYAASSSTYGDSKELPKVEERIGAPLSPYAVTKYVNELYAKVFGDLYGMEIIGLRYFNVFGKNQDPDGAYAAAIPKFIKALINHESPIIHGDGSQTRDFTYIKNVIQANELAATTSNKDAIGQVFNVAYGSSTTVNELISNLKELLSKFDSAISGVQPMNKEERIGDIKYSLASIDKAKELIGYNPKYSLYQGLEEAIVWYDKHLKK